MFVGNIQLKLGYVVSIADGSQQERGCSNGNVKILFLGFPVRIPGRKTEGKCVSAFFAGWWFLIEYGITD